MASERRAVVAFVVGEFPKPSETFLLRELRALAERGLDFVIVATRKLPEIPEAAGLMERVVLRPPLISTATAGAKLRFVATHPFRYLDAVVALFRGHWRSLRELVQAQTNLPRAMAVAYGLRRRGVTRIHALWANFPATLGWMMARGLRVPFSFSGHAWDVFVGGRMLKEKMRLATHAVACSAATAQRLKEIGGKSGARKVVLIHHGIEHDAAPEREAATEPLILAAGRFEEKKGFDVLVEACKVLADRGYGFACRIVGDGPMKGRLAAAIKEHRSRQAGAGGTYSTVSSVWIATSTRAGVKWATR